MTHLDVGTLSLIAGVLIPLITGFFVKLKAPDSVKALLTLTLAAGAGLVQTAITANGTVDVHKWLAAGAATWFLAIVSHYGLWKPTGATSFVQNLVPGFGLGSTPAVDVPPVTSPLPHPAVLQDLAVRLGIDPNVVPTDSVVRVDTPTSTSDPNNQTTTAS